MDDDQLNQYIFGSGIPGIPDDEERFMSESSRSRISWIEVLGYTGLAIGAGVLIYGLITYKNPELNNAPKNSIENHLNIKDSSSLETKL